MARKSADPVDVHVGGRVRLQRMLVGMSQERLGDLLGLTFQQVQKYEKGTNRISSSRLYQLAKHLGVAVEFFFDDLPSEHDRGHPPEPDGNLTSVMSFIGSAEGFELNRYYTRIPDVSVRKSVLQLVRCLAESALGEGPAGGIGSRHPGQPET